MELGFDMMFGMALITLLATVDINGHDNLDHRKKPGNFGGRHYRQHLIPTLLEFSLTLFPSPNSQHPTGNGFSVLLTVTCSASPKVR
jgi:hypothetical protein